MEKLKTIIPSKIKKKIKESNNQQDIISTCTLLHDYFSTTPTFHSMVEELINPQLGFCAKDIKTAFEFKNKGNVCFSSCDYSQAATFYSKALRVAPIDAVDKDNKLVAILYVNRASSLHKMNLLEESLRDCKRALLISPRYAKAWYRRGKVNSALFNYEDAICDLKVALQVEESSSGNRQIENDLLLLTSLKKTENNSQERNRKEQSVTTDELPQEKLMRVSTPTKGRGMASPSEINPASLVHKEDPFGAIISKNFRDTNCHFCFNELPADYVPCTSCSIPLYCSEQCQLQAGGDISRKCLTNKGTDDVFSGELQEYISKLTLESHLGPSAYIFTEHEHECNGVNWPVVLPAHVVLAGRIFMKLVLQGISEDLDLCHNYVHLPPESKVELHVYGIMLLYCLRSSNKTKLELHGAAFVKVITLISQVMVNSMAIVRMKYADMCHPLNQSEILSLPGDTMRSNLEQARVGQAIYLSGSLFNHSCMPNIHAYFISRTLLIRATEFIFPGCPLEMSYGPQVGQWDYRNRQEFLLDNYSFKCQCSACTRVNLPDLVLNSFRCAKPNCLGVVPDDYMIEFEKHNVCELQKTSEGHKMELQGQVMNDELKNIACLLLECYQDPSMIQPGCCLRCGHTNDLKSLRATVDKADTCIRSLQDSVISNEVFAGLLSSALSALKDLKSVLHSYNKKLAEAEDILAEAFCSLGEIQQAINHCTVSIEILKKLYSPGHIVLGNELIKLSSLQLALGDAAAIDSVKQMNTIFSNYYGKHADLLFPYLQYLKSEVHKLT